MPRRSSCSLALIALAPAVAAACGGSTDAGIAAPGQDGSPDGVGTFLPEAGAIDTGSGGDSGRVTLDGGSKDSPTVMIDSAPPPPPPGYPAPHPPMPKVLGQGGPVLAAPKLYAVTFPNEALLSSIQSFVSGIGGTPFWTANTMEYGVGPASAGTPIVLTEAAPTQIDDTQIQTWIAQKIMAGTFPAPDPNTVYAIFYPSSTSITLMGASSCNSFGGYHNEGQVPGGSRFSYAIMPRCNDINELTAATSHEFLEAATDPLPQTTPAYTGVDDDHAIWEIVLGGGEIGDMCAQFQSSFYQPAGFNFIVQRSWSNEAGAASHDPCAPSLPGEVYFNSAPVLNDSVTLSFQGQSVTTKGVQIPAGTSKTIEVDLYSDAPTSGPWTVDALDGSQFIGGNAALTFTWDNTTGQNGDKLHLTITNSGSGQLNGWPFAIHSALGTKGHIWYGFVGN